jgi:hypothetical protein
VDVFLVFRNPFYPSYKRMKVYILTSLFVVLAVYPFQRGMLLKSKD